MPTTTVPATGVIWFSDLKAAFPFADNNFLVAYRGKHPNLPATDTDISFNDFRSKTALSPSHAIAAVAGAGGMAMSAAGVISGLQGGSVTVDLGGFLANSAYQKSGTTYSLLSGTLPTNVTVSAAGVVTVPANAGTSTSSIVVRATNEWGNAFDIPLSFSITKPTRLVVTGQPASSYAAGAGFGITVEVRDDAGNKVPFSDANVVLTINKGTLAGTTSLSAASTGAVSFTGLGVTGVATGYAITASAGSLISATTNTFAITPGPAGSIAVKTQPTGVNTGASFSTTVSIRDAYGNSCTTDSTSYTISIATGPSGAVLSGTKTVNASGGEAVFSGLSVNIAGAYVFKVAGGSLSVNTSSVTMTDASGTYTFYIQTENRVSARYLNSSNATYIKYPDTGTATNDLNTYKSTYNARFDTVMSTWGIGSSYFSTYDGFVASTTKGWRKATVTCLASEKATKMQAVITANNNAASYTNVYEYYVSYTETPQTESSPSTITNTQLRVYFVSFLYITKSLAGVTLFETLYEDSPYYGDVFNPTDADMMNIAVDELLLLNGMHSGTKCQHSRVKL